MSHEEKQIKKMVKVLYIHTYMLLFEIEKKNHFNFESLS